MEDILVIVNAVTSALGYVNYVNYWPVLLLGFIIFLTFVINKIDKIKNSSIQFEFDEMPILKPVKIPTKDKGVWGAIIVWLIVDRRWELHEDFIFSINSVKYKIPKGFKFDGASVPRIFRTMVSTTGVLLIGAMIHDYLYANRHLVKEDNSFTHSFSRRESDMYFREVNTSVNGFFSLNFLAWVLLRIFGFIAWYKYRLRNK